MGLFDGLLGGGGSSADDLYAGLLTPQQLAAIRQRSAGDDLLKLAGAFAQAGQASRLPTGGIGSALGQAAASLAGSGDEGILKFLQAQKLGAEVVDKKSLAEARRALLADLQKSGQIPPGFLGGAAPGAGGTPGTGEGSAPSPGGARAVSSSTASVTLPPEARALLDSIAGPESAGAYNARWPGTTFSGYADHPRIYAPGPQGPSSAAGRYQIVASTWDPIAQEAGLTDFTPESQDKAAWYLAQKEYSRKTGGDLLTDLKAGKTDQVASALAGQWATLRQGIGSYDRNLNKYNQGGPLQLAGDVPDQIPSLDELRRGLLADPRSLDKLRGVVANLQPGGGGLLEAAPAADPLRQQYDAARARYGDRAPAESFDQYRARFANQAPGSGGGVPPAPDDGGGGGDDGGGVPVGSGLLRGGSPLLGGPLGPSPATAPTPQVGPAPGAGPLAAPVAPPVAPGPGPAGPAPGPGGLLSPSLTPGAPPIPPSSAPALPPAPASNPEMQRYIYDIARKGALAEIAGLPNVYAPLLSTLQGSPQYKALVEAATTYARESTALGFAKPKAAAEAEGKQPYDLQQRQYQSQLDREREALARTGGAELDVNKYQVPDGKGGVMELQMTRQQAADYFSGRKDVPGLPPLRSGAPEPGAAAPRAGVPVYSEGAKVAFDKLLARRDQALDLASSLEGTAEARRLLNSGVITGTGAAGRLALAKAWGLVTGETGDNVANTETFIANQAQAVARQIKAFGSGTGLSNADREYAAKMVGGETEYDEKSLRKILDIQDRAVRGYLKQFNKDATSVSTTGLPYPLRVDIPEIAPTTPTAPARTAGPATSAEPPAGMSIPPGATYLGIVGGVPKIRLPDGTTQSWRP